MLLLILLCLLFALSLSMISHHDFTITKPDVFYLEKSFGMSDQGVIKIDYNIGSSVLNASPAASVLLIIINEGQRLGYYSSTSTPLQACNYPSLYRQILYGTGSFTYSTSIRADLYSILLLQCQKGNPNNPTKSLVTTTLSNPYPSSGEGNVQYLSFDQATYVTSLEGVLIAYFILIAGLVGQIVFLK